MPPEVMTDNSTTFAFTDHFWSHDKQGVNSLFDYMHSSFDTLSHIHTLYNERAQMELEFGQKVMALSESVSAPLKHSDPKTNVAGALEAVYKELVKTAQSHIDMAQRLTNEVAPALDGWVHTHRLNLEKWSSILENKYEERQSWICHLLEAREAYHAANRSSQGRSSSELQKLEQKYRTVLTRVDSLSKDWNNTWLEACKELEGIEQDRVDFFGSNVWDYANLASARLLVQDEWCEAIRKQLEKCNMEEELSACVKQHGTGSVIPSTTDYVNYYMKNHPPTPIVEPKKPPRGKQLPPMPLDKDVNKDAPHLKDESQPKEASQARDMSSFREAPKPRASVSVSDAGSTTRRMQVKRKPLDSTLVAAHGNPVARKQQNTVGRHSTVSPGTGGLEDLLKQLEIKSIDTQSKPRSTYGSSSSSRPNLSLDTLWNDVSSSTERSMAPKSPRPKSMCLTDDSPMVGPAAAQHQHQHQPPSPSQPPQPPQSQPPALPLDSHRPPPPVSSGPPLLQGRPPHVPPVSASTSTSTSASSSVSASASASASVSNINHGHPPPLSQTHSPRMPPPSPMMPPRSPLVQQARQHNKSGSDSQGRSSSPLSFLQMDLHGPFGANSTSNESHGVQASFEQLGPQQQHHMSLLNMRRQQLIESAQGGLLDQDQLNHQLQQINQFQDTILQQKEELPSQQQQQYQQQQQHQYQQQYQQQQQQSPMIQNSYQPPMVPSPSPVQHLQRQPSTQQQQQQQQHMSSSIMQPSPMMAPGGLPALGRQPSPQPINTNHHGSISGRSPLPSPATIPTPWQSNYRQTSSPAHGVSQGSALPYVIDGRPVLRWVRGLYDYAAKVEGELSFRQGSYLAIMGPSSFDKWWMAELWDELRQDRIGSGVVPGNYIVDV
ncbi:hypothetical protein F4703DRAFT_1791012 [Phycomyces blakesleeanus]